MRKPDKQTYRYLYYYPSNIFNGDTQSYEVEPLNNSDITKVVVFAGKPVHRLVPMMDDAICYLYLEATAEISTKNVYRNLHIYEKLLCLNTGKPAGPGNRIDDISELPDIDAVLKEYGATEVDYNKPDIQHHGMAKEYNAVQMLPYSTHLMNKLGKDDGEKVERALHTFIIAEEIGYTVNPHTKVTVQATLYLSAINQLAEPEEYCSNVIDCSECGKKGIKHQSIGHAKRIEELMRSLLTGENLDAGIKLIKNGYYNVRSPFLHDGLLSGNEHEGGWASDDPGSMQFEENLVNYMNTCRRLIQLFMQAKAAK